MISCNAHGQSAVTISGYTGPELIIVPLEFAMVTSFRITDSSIRPSVPRGTIANSAQCPIVDTGGVWVWNGEEKNS